MHKFKVGDVCIGQNFTNPLVWHYNGMECTIKECLGEVVFDNGKRGVGYRVSWQHPGILDSFLYLGEIHFRLKRPPEQLGSWDRIIELINYDPRKAPVEKKEEELVHE